MKEELKSVNRIDYAKIISHVYGLEYALNWIKKNKDVDFGEGIFKSIGKFSSHDDIEKLIQKSEYEYEELIIILNSLLKAGNKEKTKEIESAEKWNKKHHIIITNKVTEILQNKSV